MNINYIVAPIVGSVIGYTTNWLAIKMLFKPHRAYHIGKIKIPFTPGLIPRERDRIAKSLGEAVGGNLLTEEVILKELTHPKVVESLKAYVLKDLLGKEMSLEHGIKLFYPEAETLYQKIANIIQGSIINYIQGDAKFRQLMQSKVSLVLDRDKTVSSILGDDVDLEINRLLHEHKLPIAHQVCMFLGEDTVGDKIKSILGSIINEKIGGLAAMFMQPASLYGMITEFVNSYFESEEHQTQLVQGIILIKDKALKNRLSDILEDDQYIEVVEKISNVLEEQILLFIQNETFGQMMIDVLQSMAKMPVTLTDDMKITLEKTVEEQYLKFATTHLPVFLEQFNVTSIVESEINKFSVDEVEELIFKIVDKELNAITWLGALLGLIMGAITLFF